MANDRFKTRRTEMGDPFEDTFPITADAAIQPTGYGAALVTRGICVQTAGQLDFVNKDGQDRSHYVTVGVHPIRLQQVKGTSTAVVAYGGI